MRGAWLGIAAPFVLVLVLVLAACSSDDTASVGADGGADAPLFEADAAEASSLTPVDAGPLWQTCNPLNIASCPSGLECLGVHTTPVDAYGTCVFSCAGASGPSCTLSGGTCVCPLTYADTPGDCSEGNDAGDVTVCVPASDAGVPGNNQLEDTGAPVPEAGIADAPHETG